MDADHFAALALILLALVLLAWGTARALQEDSAPTPPPADDARDFASDAARRYHESDAVGR